MCGDLFTASPRILPGAKPHRPLDVGVDRLETCKKKTIQPRLGRTTPQSEVLNGETRKESSTLVFWMFFLLFDLYWMPGCSGRGTRTGFNGTL